MWVSKVTGGSGVVIKGILIKSTKLETCVDINETQLKVIFNNISIEDYDNTYRSVTARKIQPRRTQVILLFEIKVVAVNFKIFFYRAKVFTAQDHDLAETSLRNSGCEQTKLPTFRLTKNLWVILWLHMVDINPWKHCWYLSRWFGSTLTFCVLSSVTAASIAGLNPQWSYCCFLTWDLSFRLQNNTSTGTWLIRRRSSPLVIVSDQSITQSSLLTVVVTFNVLLLPIYSHIYSGIPQVWNSYW